MAQDHILGFPQPIRDQKTTQADDYFSKFRELANHPDSASQIFLTIYENPDADPTEYSFNSFWEGCKSYARQLSEFGVNAGDVVLIFSGTRIEAYFAFFGAQLAGAVPSIMPPATIKQNLDFYRASHHELLRRIKPALVCGPHEALQVLDLDGEAVMRRSFEEFAAPMPPCREERFETWARPARDLALLQHSSGTTGLKKGVMLSYHAVVTQIRHYAQAIALHRGDRVVSWLPLYHDMGLIACTVMPFVMGIPVVVMDPFVWLGKPLLMLRAAERHRATVAWLPNFAFEHLANFGRRLREPDLDLSALRMLIDCSEVCRPATLDRFYQCFGRFRLGRGCLHTCYALAENVFAASQSSPAAGPTRLLVDVRALDNNEIRLLGAASADAANARELISSGHPIAGCDVAVIGERGLTRDDDTLGELVLHSDCLFEGYYKNEELSRERLLDAWYHSRDLGFLHDGEVYVLGRIDDVIVYRGRNVFAADLEASLLGVPGIKPGRTIAFGVYSESLGSENVVVLTETIEIQPTDQSIETAESLIRARLHDNFGINPLHVVTMPPDALVKTTSGKISRSENKRQFIQSIQVSRK